MSRTHTKFINLGLPLASVLVPVYNRQEFIPRTLQSLKDQTYQNCEFIIINDGGESAKHLVDAMNDSRFKYFEHDKNKGLAAARNTGLRNSSGEVISLLDSDDIYNKYALEFRITALQKLKVDVVYTRSLKHIMDRVEGRDGSIGYKIVHTELYWNMEFDKDRMLIYNIAPCCCPLITRKAQEDADMWFPEDLDTSEDQYAWTKLSRKYDFHNLELCDSECSFVRNSKMNMTGTRNFAKNWIKIYKDFRHTAINYEWVKNTQNQTLINAGINPEDYGL